MAQKKVLVITYYWPPSGGGGVQRWLKFVKFLPEFGWTPIVFTPENPAFDLTDPTLNKDVSPDLEVLRFPIWEPFGFYKKLFKKEGKLKQGIVIEKTNMSWKDKVSVWVRANLFVPDPRRFWVRPSVQFLKSYIASEGIDLIVTTGPPHSMHLIGKGLKKACGVPWIADFRDPWSDWDILDKLDVTRVVRSMHRRMERAVLQQADLTLTVSRRLAEALTAKAGGKKVQVITNGVDADDFASLDQVPKVRRFRITHMGLLNEIRNPEVLWQVLEELCEEDEVLTRDLEIVLAGMVSQSILDRLNNSNSLAGCLTHLDYISHEEVFKYYQNSSVLLLLLNQTANAQWILPGKLFEYLLANKPILTLGEPESDVRDVLVETGKGEVFHFDDRQNIRRMILSAYAAFKNGTHSVTHDEYNQYLRRNLTAQLAHIMDGLMAIKIQE